MEQLLQRTFEAVVLTTLHPRTCITLVVQVMRDDGSISRSPALLCVLRGAICAVAPLCLRCMAAAPCRPVICNALFCAALVPSPASVRTL